LLIDTTKPHGPRSCSRVTSAGVLQTEASAKFPRRASQVTSTLETIVGEAWVRCHDIRFDDFPDDLFENNELIRDCNGTTEWREVVAV